MDILILMYEVFLVKLKCLFHQESEFDLGEIKEIVTHKEIPLVICESVDDVESHLQGEESVFLVTDCSDPRHLISWKNIHPQVYIAVVTPLKLKEIITTVPDLFFQADCLINQKYTQLNLHLLRILFKEFEEKGIPSINYERVEPGEYESRTVNKSGDRDDIIQSITPVLEEKEVNMHQMTYFVDVCDEYITNAIYDAPKTSEGSPKYYSRDRSQAFELAPYENVEVKWKVGENYITMSVVDQFGSLRKEDIFRVLSKCFSGSKHVVNLSKETSAQVGFFKVLSGVCDVVVNIEQGKTTELICIVDRSLNRRAFRTTARSVFFNYL